MTKMPISLIKHMAAASVFLMLCVAHSAAAQTLFDPVVKVDETVVTQYEWDQRMALMQALNQTGDIESLALDQLIDERLQVAAAARLGVVATPEAIDAGMEEFAQRADLTKEEFLNALSQEGVDAESFRDFVTAGIVWRETVQQEFTRFVNVSEADIDRAISLTGTIGSAEIQFSEIYLPTDTPQNEQLTLELAPQITALTSIDQFADAARRFSVGQTRNQGGVVEGWVDIAQLPPAIRQALADMKPGEVAEPIEIPNALAIFQLRGIRETVAPPSPNLQVDYAAYYIPGGRSPEALQRAAKIRSEIDVCDDLYGIAQGQPPSVLDREKLPVSQIPRDYAIELAKLDAGESSTALTRSNGQTLVFLMMCGRDRNPPVKPEEGQTQEEAEEANREQIRAQLFNKRVTELAAAYLDELRAEAVIVRQ